MQTVDLVNHSWSVDDFRQNVFQIEEAPQDLAERIRVVYQRKEEQAPSEAAPPLPPATKVESQESEHLTHIVRVFDATVISEMSEGAREIVQVEGVAKKQKIEQEMEKLNRLAANLQAHDTYIQEYNQHHFSHCPTHEEALTLLQTHLNVLVSEKDDVTMEQLVHFLHEVEGADSQEKEIDWHYLVGSSAAFMQLLETLDSPTDRTSSREVYQKAFNHLYIKQLYDQGFHLSNTIQQIFFNLGFSQTQMAAAMNAIILEFKDVVDQLLATEDLSKIEVPELIHRLQEQVFLLMGKELGLEIQQIERIKGILETVNRAESRWGHLHYYVRNASQKIENSILEEQTSDAIRSKFSEGLKKSRYEPRFNKVIESVLNSQALKQALLANEKDFTGFLIELNEEVSLENEEIVPFFEKEVKKIQKDFLKLMDATTKKEWVERNRIYRNFSFVQTEWGLSHVLGKGVCAALNYRWIKELLKDPFKKIKSHKDFDRESLKSEERNPNLSSILEKTRNRIEHSSAVESARAQLRQKEALTAEEMGEFEEMPPQLSLGRQDSSIGVKGEDRWIQAQYQVEKFEKETAAIHQQVLAKDHMQVRRLMGGNPSTISALIDAIWAKEKESPSLLGQSWGIFGINIYRAREEQGKQKWRDPHVMGMQIDRASGIYRFWDVNSGFYTYPNLETLKREAEAYIHEFYGKDKRGIEYNNFSAIQYFNSG